VTVAAEWLDLAPRSRATYFKGWDVTIIPKLFSRLVFVYGDAIDVPTALDGAGLERYRADIENRLRRLTYQVNHWFAERDCLADPREVIVPEPVPLPVHPPRRWRAAPAQHQSADERPGDGTPG
jgi:hypothetical protein